MVKFEDNGTTLTIDAPDKMVFATYGTHYEFILPYDGWTKSQIYDEFIHIMKDGVILCDNKECEYCNN